MTEIKYDQYNRNRLNPKDFDDIYRRVIRPCVDLLIITRAGVLLS